jgi:hypothetical protein
MVLCRLLKVVLDFCARHNIKLLLTIDGFDRDKKETEIGGGMGGEEEDDEEGGGKTTVCIPALCRSIFSSFLIYPSHHLLPTSSPICVLTCVRWCVRVAD